MGELCAKAGVPLIADEVFYPYRLGRGSQRVRLASDGQSVVITLDGLSKLLAAPQLKLGWLRVGGPSSLTAALAARLDAIADTYLSVNSPVACALPDLLGLVDGTVARVLERCQANLAQLRELGDGFRVRRVEGGWVALVDLPPVGDDDQIARELLRCGLFAHPGWLYDVGDTGVLAISLLPEPAAFGELCNRLAALVDDLSG